MEGATDPGALLDGSRGGSIDFGLALGGGSFRGFAHVGVIEVLAREGLMPSWLAGTSAGAIAASLIAFGVPLAEMYGAVEEVNWASIARLRPLAPIGTLTNEGIEAALVRLLGDARIEDSPIPLRIVATDIVAGERVVLHRGPVARAVRASSCIPGVFAPVQLGGQLLVDGALVENIPVQTAREHRSGVVAAVGLGFDLPFSRLTNAAQVLANAFEIAVDAPSRVQLRQADVAMEPALQSYSRTRPADRAAVIAAGRQSAEEAVPRLREALGQNRDPAPGRPLSVPDAQP